MSSRFPFSISPSDGRQRKRVKDTPRRFTSERYIEAYLMARDTLRRIHGNVHTAGPLLEPRTTNAPSSTT